MKHVLFIVAVRGYQDIEYGTPKTMLEDAGYTVTTASAQTGQSSGKQGGITQATVALQDVNIQDYDAIVFVGGPGAVEYQQDTGAHRIISDSLEAEKILAAICIAPTILAYAGALQDKAATVWNGDGEQSAVLENNGARFQDQPVVQDGAIITANGPDAAEAFAEAIIQQLKA